MNRWSRKNRKCRGESMCSTDNRFTQLKKVSAFALNHPKSGERVLANRKEDLVLGAGMTKPPSDEPE